MSARTVEITVEYLNALRKAAGAAIDPQTAEVTWGYGYVLDPYDDGRDIPPEGKCVGRDYFARLWIWFGDLPDATRRTLEERPARAAVNVPSAPPPASADRVPLAANAPLKAKRRKPPAVPALKKSRKR